MQKETSWGQDEMEYNGGTLEGTSLGTTPRGGHFNLAIGDNPIRDDMKYTMEYIINYFQGVYKPTILRKKGRYIIVGTPQDPEDLFHVLQNSKLDKNNRPLGKTVLEGISAAGFYSAVFPGITNMKKKEVLVKIRALTSGLVAKIPLLIDMNGCFDFKITGLEDSYEVCKDTSNIIYLELKNDKQTGAIYIIETEGESLKMSEEIIPKVVLYLARGTYKDPTHQEPEHTLEDSEPHDEPCVDGQLGCRHARLNGVDGVLEHPWNSQRDGVGDDNEDQARGDSPLVFAKIWFKPVKTAHCIALRFAIYRCRLTSMCLPTSRVPPPVCDWTCEDQ